MVAGLRHDYHALNGAQLITSAEFTPRFPRRESFSSSATGRKRLSRAYDGAGLPDVPDVAEFSLRWDLGSEEESTITQIEDARYSAGPHEFIIWKKRRAIYTAATGQTVFYLPRVDAFTDSISGHTATDDKAVVTVNGVSITVVYGTVTSATTVDTGEVWISNAEADHPGTGLTCTLFKFGDALTAGDVVVVEYFPRYMVQIQDAEDDMNTAGREDKTILFVEVTD